MARRLNNDILHRRQLPDGVAPPSAQEQKAVKETVFDLQMNPAAPGLQFHRIDKSKDPNFWSMRVSRDIRLIVHKTEDSFLICYVDHHDAAYLWAERRRIETHPRTGAAQIVEVRSASRKSSFTSRWRWSSRQRRSALFCRHCFPASRTKNFSPTACRSIGLPT